jgi:curli biogenesis system outer membrane secretion channel CsgG
MLPQSFAFRLARFACALALLALVALGDVSPAFADANPSIAVLDFGTQGLTGDWWGQFEPGVALSDLVADQLVNGHKFNVLERKKLDAVMDEHKLSAAGETSPATMIQSGRLTGAKYLVTGNVIQFERTGESGGRAGSILPGWIGAAAGGLHRERVTLKVQVHIIDATTGTIVQSFAGEKTQASTSWDAGGWAAGIGVVGGGSYSNSSFTSSTMGHLINDEAIEIAGKLDPAQFSSAAAAAAAAAINGRIIASDSGGIILNVGSAKGVQTGMFFDVMQVRSIKDPDSGKMLSVASSTGKVQITQVNADSAVAVKVSGTITVGEKVQSEQ